MEAFFLSCQRSVDCEGDPAARMGSVWSAASSWAVESHNEPPRHGLPLFGDVRLAVDTIVDCALHGDGRPRSGVDERDGVAFFAARKAKERIYPEFVGAQARARLVPAVEVGGMFSKETDGFFTGLAKAFARRRLEQEWRLWLVARMRGGTNCCRISFRDARVHRRRWDHSSGA